MRQRIISGCVAALTAAVPVGAQLQNGDFEQGPPALPGWREVGNVPSGSVGSQNTANAARIGPSDGVALQLGAWHGSAIWQNFDHGVASLPCTIEFDYRLAPGACAWVEVDGPVGIHGAFLPANLLYGTVHVDYPTCGNLTISFNVIEAGTSSVTQLLQVDEHRVRRFRTGCA